MRDLIISWLREITGYYELSNELKTTIEILKQENINKHLVIEEQIIELAELETKYLTIKNKVEELIKKETINILELRAWYESRRRQETWKYNGYRLGYVDVTDYLEVKDKTGFTELANTIINEYGLTTSDSPSEIVSQIYRYWNKRNSWTYITDLQLHKKIEYWEDASDALKTRRGDCETKAMCMYWTIDEVLRILGKSEHDWRLTFVASIVAGEGGHGYLTWLHDDGEYYVVESTYYNVSNYHKTWLRTPMRFNNMYQDPWGFANKYRSWKGNNSSLLSFKE